MPSHPTSRARSTVDRLRDEILAIVSSDGLVPGDRLPTEQELADRLGISRSTIREALRTLEQEGLLRAVQGKGRFLSAIGSLRVERPVTKYESITDMLEGLGYEVSNVVLDVAEVPAEPVVARHLQLAEGDPVLRIVRLRLGDERPLVFSISTVPRSMLPGPVAHRDWSGSLSRALELQGHAPVSSTARISAVNVPEPYAERYSLGEYDPWLLVTETSVTAEGVPVVYATDYHRGSDIAFNVLRRL